MKTRIPATRHPAALILLTAIFTFAFAHPLQPALPPRFGGSLTIGTPYKYISSDPATAFSEQEFSLVTNVFEPLVSTTISGTTTPVLIESLPSISSDGLTYTFTLKPGILFHDGSPLDAADVLHSMRRLLKSNSSPYSWILRDLEGADKYRDGKSPSLSGFRLTGTLTFQLKLTRKQPLLLKYLSLPAASIISTSYNGQGIPSGTGPFKIKGRSQKGETTLTAFDSYRNGRPYLDSITFKPVRDGRDRLTEFKRGTLDITDSPISGLSNLEKYYIPSLMPGQMKRLYFLDINPTIPPFSKVAYRRAISSKIDRDGIVKAILNNNASPQNNSTKPGDPKATARAASTSPTLQLWYQAHIPELQLIAEKIKYDLKKLDIQITTVPKGPADLLSYSDTSAPAMILRSTPMLLDMTDSLSETLFNPRFGSDYITLSLRISHKKKHPTAEIKTPHILTLFSYHPSYLSKPSVKGLTIGPYGNLDLDDAYIR